jgi:hypothetical protein
MSDKYVFMWTDLFDPDRIYEFLLRVKYFREIEEININSEQKFTEIKYDKRYSITLSKENFSKTANLEIIPDIFYIKEDKTLVFKFQKMFEIKDFKDLREYIKNYCSHIYEFLFDNNITTCLIDCSLQISRDSTLNGIKDKINNLKEILEWINDDTDFDQFQIYVFAAILKQFYNGNPEDNKSLSLSNNSKIVFIKNKFQNLFKQPEQFIVNSDLTNLLNSEFIDKGFNLFHYKFIENFIVTDLNKKFINMHELKLLNSINQEFYTRSL